MEAPFDAAKDAANVQKHGISLSRAFDMDLDLTITFNDDRYPYNEARYISIGPIDASLYVLPTPTGMTKSVRSVSVWLRGRRRSSTGRAGSRPLPSPQP